MLMAGRAAQQIVVGKVSAGSAGSDESGLARATKMALAMERSLGFGAIQPLLYRDDKDPTAVLDGIPISQPASMRDWKGHLRGRSKSSVRTATSSTRSPRRRSMRRLWMARR